MCAEGQGPRRVHLTIRRKTALPARGLRQTVSFRAPCVRRSEAELNGRSEETDGGGKLYDRGAGGGAGPSLRRPAGSVWSWTVSAQQLPVYN